MLTVVLFGGCKSDPDEGLYASIADGRSLSVPAMTGGKILQLNVDAGNTVAQNQILGVIDTTELHLQRNLILAQFKELAIQTSLAENGVKQAALQYNYVAEKQQRIGELFAKNSTSRQSLDDVNNQLPQTKLALSQARNNAQTVSAKQGQLQAQLDLVNKKIVDAVIRAPEAGIVSERFYEPGEAIAPFAPLVEIINLNEIEIKIYINERQLPQIKAGQSATIHIDGDAAPMPGTVSWINSKAEFTPKSVLTAGNRTSLVYAVKILIKNPNGILKHGMPVTVEL